MANWSETEVTFNGKRAKEAYEYINGFYDGKGLSLSKLNEDGIELGDNGYNYLDELSISSNFNNKDVENHSITICGSGRWCGPSGFFKHVAESFDLSGEYADAEAGSNFFHLVRFEDGDVVAEIEDEYFSKASTEYNDDLEYWICHYEGCFVDDEEGLNEIIKEFKKYFQKDIDEDTEEEIRETLRN